MRKEILLPIMIFISACSGSGGDSSPSPAQPASPWVSFSVSIASDLPTCAGEIVGRLYYVESTDSFKVCKSTGWTDISMGPKISKILYCSKTSGSTNFKHQVVTYSTGNKEVYCSISDSLSTFSASITYLSTQTGAVNEGCLLNYDLDTGSGGYWNFSVNSGTRTAVYNDSGSASNGSTVTFATSDCLTVQ